MASSSATRTKVNQNSVNQSKTKRYKPVDFLLCVTVLLLLALGIIMVLSASSPAALSESGNSYKYVSKQALAAGLGLAVMFFISRMDYRRFKPLYKIAYFVSVGLLMLVPIIGSDANGAKRWIDLGPLGTFQPSEIAKIGLIIFFAAYLTDHKDELKSTWKGFVKPFLWLVPPVFILVFFQDHLSASIVIVVVISAMMLVAGTRLRDFLTLGVGVAGAGIGALVLMAQITGKGNFRLDRITSFLDPWADQAGDGYQTIQSLYAIGSGGLFGAGLGNSKQKYLYLPFPHNDFIFAVIAEELGFVGCVAIILLFAVFIWRGTLISIKAEDTFGSLLATGITALIAIQVIINIAVVTNSMPVTGMSLPFFSYGGTALIILLAGVGVLLSVSRRTNRA